MPRLIDLRKYYTTEGGLLVELYCFDPRPSFQLPVKGRIFYRDERNISRVQWETWTKWGKYAVEKDHHKDLVEVSSIVHLRLKQSLEPRHVREKQINKS